jgi:hypothetical protein
MLQLLSCLPYAVITYLKSPAFGLKMLILDKAAIGLFSI